MSLSSLKKKPRFLADENIKKELVKFLVSKGFDVIPVPKGYANGNLAKISLSESRILITNDAHFTDPVMFSKEKIFAVILLRIPQNDSEALLHSFSALLKEKARQKDFEGLLITLKKDGFESSPIKSL